MILDRKKIVRRLSLVNLLALLLVIGATERALAQGKLVVAIQPSVSSDEMLKKARPLEKFLRDGLGGKTDVQVYVPSSFAAVVESLRFGHAQVAFMSAWPAQLAVQLGGAEVALAEVREVLHGTKKVEAPYYFSYWIVQKDSSYQNLQA
jgi:phosphonate transport system substrate-binding protein